jgi:hypothetical protein
MIVLTTGRLGELTHAQRKHALPSPPFTLFQQYHVTQSTSAVNEMMEMMQCSAITMFQH